MTTSGGLNEHVSLNIAKLPSCKKSNQGFIMCLSVSMSLPGKSDVLVAMQNI